MVNFDDIENGDLISFQLIKSGLIDATFKGVIVQGIVNYSVAVCSDSELIVKHNTLYPYFTNKENYNNPNKYQYIIVQDGTSGKLTPIGLPWINQSTLEILTQGNWTIDVQCLNSKQQNYLRDILTRLGCPFTITVNE